MEAKILFERSLKLTGTHLFVILTAALTLVSATLDWLAARSLWQGFSLTLPFVFCLVVSAGIGFGVVPLLKAYKMGQIIREDGPQAHLKKAGTPTMGGIFFVPVGVLVALLWSGFSTSVVAVCGLTLAYAAIGWLDDWQILRRRSNKGISPRTKLVLQILFAVAFCVWLFFNQPAGITNLALPFGWVLPLGLFYWFFSGFLLVAESNATNITDGVDGLAAGTGAIALLGLGTMVSATHPDLMLFCAAMAGSYMGFLMHNRNPARVFMGDTGSLALGGAITTVAILTNHIWVLPILGGVFLLETLSVMLQVYYFKLTKNEEGVGKRLFKMAPLHHHLELSGWSEIRVVGTFYLLTALLAIVCLSLH